MFTLLSGELPQIRLNAYNKPNIITLTFKNKEDLESVIKFFKEKQYSYQTTTDLCLEITTFDTSKSSKNFMVFFELLEALEKTKEPFYASIILNFCRLLNIDSISQKQDYTQSDFGICFELFKICHTSEAMRGQCERLINLMSTLGVVDLPLNNVSVKIFSALEKKYAYRFSDFDAVTREIIQHFKFFREKCGLAHDKGSIDFFITMIENDRKRKALYEFMQQILVDHPSLKFSESDSLLNINKLLDYGFTPDLYKEFISLPSENGFEENLRLWAFSKAIKILIGNNKLNKLIFSENNFDEKKAIVQEVFGITARYENANFLFCLVKEAGALCEILSGIASEAIRQIIILFFSYDQNFLEYGFTEGAYQEMYDLQGSNNFKKILRLFVSRRIQMELNSDIGLLSRINFKSSHQEKKSLVQEILGASDNCSRVETLFNLIRDEAYIHVTLGVDYSEDERDNILKHISLYPEIFEYGFTKNNHTDFSSFCVDENFMACLRSYVLSKTKKFLESNENHIGEIAHAFSPEEKKLIIEKILGIKENCFHIETLFNFVKEEIETCQIQHGPLSKNKSTLYLEFLMNKIIDIDEKKYSCYLNENNEYILSMDSGEPINLTLLLSNVNMTHFSLGSETLATLNKMLNRLIGSYYSVNPQIFHCDSSDQFAGKLPPYLLRAIQIYNLRFYQNCNRLFRGEVLLQENDHISVGENVILNLALNCIIHAAINQMPIILKDDTIYPNERAIFKKIDNENLSKVKDEEQYQQLLNQELMAGTISQEEYHLVYTRYEYLFLLFSDFTQLLRDERLDEKTVEDRCASRIIKIPALTSGSYDKNGSHFFRDKGFQRTRFHNIPHLFSIEHLVKEKSEREVILPQGLTAIYYKSSDGILDASIVSSPKFQKSDDYWSQHALRYAYKHHLSQAYKHVSDARTIGDIKVARSNHGLAHTARVMSYIPLVIEYFQIHAKDEGFRDFCRDITHEQLQLLKIAAAFSVTGRESEVGFRDNLELYNQYRVASREHFEAYFKQTSEMFGMEKLQAEEIASMSEVIQHMGNPNYPSFEAKTELMQQDNFRTRSYFYYILSMAHKLDLPRCYSKEHFFGAFGSMNDILDTPIDESNQDFQQLMRYAINLMQEQGNMQHCDITPDGEWVNCHKSYRPPFGTCSTSFKALDRSISIVATPQLTETMPEVSTAVISTSLRR